MNIRQLSFFSLACALLLSGCGRSITSSSGEPSNLQRWVEEVRARPAEPLPPLPVMQQFETFAYSAHDRRDPFSDAWLSDGAGSGLRPDPDRRKEPLEAFPLDGLRVVGSIGAGTGLTALMLAPDKVTYRVRPGMYLGQSDGRVTSVHEDRVELVELVPDGAGGWVERPAAIALDDQ